MIYEKLERFNSKVRSNSHTLSHFKTDLFPWNFERARFCKNFLIGWLNTLKMKIRQQEVILRH